MLSIEFNLNIKPRTVSLNPDVGHLQNSLKSLKKCKDLLPLQAWIIKMAVTCSHYIKLTS